MTSSITANICHWRSAGAAYEAAAENYHSWIMSLWNGVVCYMRQNTHGPGTPGISPSTALWLFQTQCMPTATNSMEYNLEQENDALSVSNSLRSLISGAQNTYNRVVNDIENGISQRQVLPHGSVITGPKSLGNALVAQLKNLSGILNNVPGLNLIMGSANLADLQGYVNGLEHMLSGDPIVEHIVSLHTHNGVTHYNSALITYTIYINPYNGRGTKVNYTVWNRVSHNWQNISRICHSVQLAGGVYSKLRSAYSQAVNAGKQVPPVFSDVTSNFNNLNQSVSGVSSYIQTQMQYLNQNLQQYFSVYSNFFQDYNTLNSYIINKMTGG